jgi:hypothetical protein
MFGRDQEVGTAQCEEEENGDWLAMRPPAPARPQLERVQQLLQRLCSASVIGCIGGLSDRDAQALGIEADLGNEFCCARVGFSDGAPQRLAVTDQAVEAFLAMHGCMRSGLLGRTSTRSGLAPSCQLNNLLIQNT